MMSEERTQGQKAMKRWKMHRNALIELAAVFPESKGSWRPWEKGMTVIELVHHLAWTPEFFLAPIEGREMNIPPVPETLPEARKLLEELTNVHEEIIASLTDEDLKSETTIDLFKLTEPTEEMLYRLIGHEAHHKGQLILYARILGVEPPFYVDLSL
ncbi:DinB family protein [Bacillus sp. FJAT-42376]|nr:DinB family protein [Bacillus sp. FJAT-42376]